MAVSETLYSRLGGYDAIAAVSENLVGRLMADPKLGRFRAQRGDDGLKRVCSFSSISCATPPAALWFIRDAT